MAALRYKDEHNKVGYLLKPTGSDDYHQIIDFLRASHIRSPELGPLAIQATIDKTPYTITEDLVRSQLQLADDGGIDDLPIAEIYSGMDNLRLNFEGHPMPLLAAMLSQAPKGEGSGVAAQAVLQHMPAPDQPQDHLSTSRRQQTSDHNAPVFQHGQISDPNIASLSRTHETDDGYFTNVDDEPLGGSFHMSLPRSTPAPSESQTSGGAEDLITLTALSSIVSTLVQKVNSLETKLKDHKKLFKDVVGKLVKKVKAMEVKLRITKKKMVVSDSDQEEGGKQYMDLDALLALANAAMTVDSNISPGGASDNPAASTSVPADVPTCANVPSGSTSVPADVPTSVAPAGVSNKGKAPMVEEDITVKKGHLSRCKRIDLVSRLQKGYLMKNKLKWTDKEQRCKEGDNKRFLLPPCIILRLIGSTSWLRTLKRTGPVLEEPSSKRQKSTEAPIPCVPEVPQSPVVSSSKSSGTKRKSLGKNRLTKPKSKLRELDLDADDQTFIKVVSDKDSEDEAPLPWSAFVGWKVLTTPLGDINALYRIDRCCLILTKEVRVLLFRRINIFGRFEVGDVSYPLSVKLMERMLTYKLEIDKDVVGNDMTTAEQLIRFIKNQLAAA
nr:hypothetical protein [Tanacetum cinerariifolium]